MHNTHHRQVDNTPADKQTLINWHKLSLCACVHMRVPVNVCCVCDVLYVLPCASLVLVLTLSCSVLSCPVLPCLSRVVLSSIAMPYLAVPILSGLVLPCHVLPCFASLCLSLLCRVFHCLALPILSCVACPVLVLPSLVLSGLDLFSSCRVCACIPLSSSVIYCLVMRCIAMSCLALSHLVLVPCRPVVYDIVALRCLACTHRGKQIQHLWYEARHRISSVCTNNCVWCILKHNNNTR